MVLFSCENSLDKVKEFIDTDYTDCFVYELTRDEWEKRYKS